MVCGSTGLNTDLIKYFESIGMQQGNSKTPGEFVSRKGFCTKIKKYIYFLTRTYNRNHFPQRRKQIVQMWEKLKY